ncbi:ORF MSV050 hypothetical protein [Melanoplus sanguinipes entomopoxvirus]|uniref:Uncharacterized protein n=1 Tax=Melanoplus sanguinipes entomopoxvirus TaxID=83191 RepID=Q9YW42_MSEPV|nr:ORF MSV050 hypothetical protein [Melanoplus sanguinipes entomopoxvirus]AAC97619.1 ORF MSV050 hypothetical protein [Melanoplus sanguinipes entomopoxvirus 'O']
MKPSLSLIIITIIYIITVIIFCIIAFYKKKEPPISPINENVKYIMNDNDNDISIMSSNNLSIALYVATNTTVYTSMQNINTAITPRPDIVFISEANYNNEAAELKFNSVRIDVPRSNIDNHNLYAQTEIPGYISYSNLNNNHSYIGVNSDSIFSYHDKAKSELYDKICDNNGALLSFPVKIISGTFKDKLLRLIHISQPKGTNGYENMESFKIIYYLFNYIMEKFKDDLVIIAGNCNIRNELIDLAMKKTGLNKKCKLYPPNNYITTNYVNNVVNINAIIVDYKLILDKHVTISTHSPWLYENRYHYILLLTIHNFKDKNYLRNKEYYRTKWAITKNGLKANNWSIPKKFIDLEKPDEKHIRDNVKLTDIVDNTKLLQR